jgi:hypothetical protein
MKTALHFCIAIFLVALVVVLTITCEVQTEAAILMIAFTTPAYFLGFFLLRFLLTKKVKAERWGGIVHERRVWRWEK